MLVVIAVAGRDSKWRRSPNLGQNKDGGRASPFMDIRIPPSKSFQETSFSLSKSLALNAQGKTIVFCIVALMALWLPIQTNMIRSADRSATHQKIPLKIGHGEEQKQGSRHSRVLRIRQKEENLSINNAFMNVLLGSAKILKKDGNDEEEKEKKMS
jgi:hypothetical protein